MTRLQDFADRLVVEILDGGDCHCATSHVEMRAVAERMVRELIASLPGGPHYNARYLEQPEPTEKP